MHLSNIHFRDERSPLGSDFQVILLQRDPRATIHSLRAEPQEWLPNAASPAKICGNLLEDYNNVMEVATYFASKRDFNEHVQDKHKVMLMTLARVFTRNRI